MDKNWARRKNRGWIEIAADILRVVGPGTRRTRIMYQANLSFSMLNKYCDSLLRAGLLIEDHDRILRVSPMGQTFLRYCDELMALRERSFDVEEKLQSVVQNLKH